MRKLLFLLFLLPLTAFGQAGRYDSFAYANISSTIRPVSGAVITVCTSSASGTPCSPKATIYTDVTATSAAANPFTSDSSGNFGFWALPGTYLVTVTGSGLNPYTLNVVISATLPGVNTFTAPNAFVNNGVFTATQMNEYLKSSVNGCNPATEFARGNSSSATEAVTGCTAIPANATNIMGTGGSFYASSSAGNPSPVGPGLPVGVLAQGTCLVDNCWGWAGNLIYEDDGSRTTGMWAHGLEIDIGQQSPSTAYTGGGVGVSGLLINIGGNGSGNVATGYALGVGTQSPTKQFGYAFFTQNGAAAHGFLLGATAATGTVTSQDITFEGLNSGTPATATISGSSLGDVNIDSAAGRFLNIRGGGNLGIQEQTSGTASGGFDVLYGDSAAHCLKASYNNGGFFCIPLIGIANTWSALQTFGTNISIGGVTATGATGTGSVVFSAAPTITGHPTIEGVTSTGATGTGNLVFSASPTFTGTAAVASINASGGVTAATYATGSNCASSGGTCGSAAAGAVTIAASGTTVTVNTTAVTANSQIFVQFDESLGTRLSTTCNSASASENATYVVSARSAGASFTIKTNTAPTTNPACLSYHIVN